MPKWRDIRCEREGLEEVVGGKVLKGGLRRIPILSHREISGHGGAGDSRGYYEE